MILERPAPSGAGKAYSLSAFLGTNKTVNHNCHDAQYSLVRLLRDLALSEGNHHNAKAVREQFQALEVDISQVKPPYF